MTESTLRRAVGFIRCLAHNCPCLYRNDMRCEECDYKTAKSIIEEIDREESSNKAIDYSYYARQSKIIEILKTSGRPMFSNEINLNGTCSIQLKHWTLQYMIRKGLIGRKFAYCKNNKKFFRYYLKQEKEKK